MRSRPSILGLAAAALSGAVAVLYLVLIARGLVGVSGDAGRVTIVALILVGQSSLAALGSVRRSVPMLALAAVLLVITGVLGLFSIGLPLLFAASLAVAAAAREWARPPPTR